MVKGRELKELPRRLFHIFGGLCLPIVGWLLPRNIFLPSLFTITIIFLVFEVLRLRSQQVNRWFSAHFQALLRETEASRFTGSTYLLIASSIAFLLFDKSIAVVSLCFAALGDPVAGIIGERWGRRKIRSKSLEGSCACFLACLTIGTILASVTHISLPLVIVGALCATFIELLSLPVNDNLTIPLVSGGVITGVKLILASN